MAGGVLHDLLEVVEDDEAAAAAGDGVAELHRGIVPAERHVERRGDGEEDAVERARLGEVAEVDATRPVAEPRPAVAADEARLAGAAGAEHREQPRAGVEPRASARSSAVRPTKASRSAGRLWRTSRTGRQKSPARTTR